MCPKGKLLCIISRESKKYKSWKQNGNKHYFDAFFIGTSKYMCMELVGLRKFGSEVAQCVEFKMKVLWVRIHLGKKITSSVGLETITIIIDA